MTPTERIDAALVAAGWVADGVTDAEVVRVPTSRSPVFGGAGGELRTIGGRRRYRFGNTDRFVTVGPRTVNFYRKGPAGAVSDFVQFKTATVNATVNAIVELLQ